MGNLFQIDDKTLEKARSISEANHLDLEVVLNEALSRGLTELTYSKKAVHEPYVNRARDLELRKGLDLADTGDLLSELDAEAFE